MSNKWDEEKRKKGRREEGEMWYCHNETMSEEKPCLISWLKCKSSEYGEEWRRKQAEKGGGKKRRGSDGGKQLVWLLAERMKIHHRWNTKAWDPSLCATTRLCEEMSTCFSSLLKQLVTSCLSVGGTKKIQWGVGGISFSVGKLHHKQRKVQEKPAVGSCGVSGRKCTFQQWKCASPPLNPCTTSNFQLYCQICHKCSTYSTIEISVLLDPARLNKPLKKTTMNWISFGVKSAVLNSLCSWAVCCPESTSSPPSMEVKGASPEGP